MLQCLPLQHLNTPMMSTGPATLTVLADITFHVIHGSGPGIFMYKLYTGWHCLVSGALGICHRHVSQHPKYTTSFKGPVKYITCKIYSWTILSWMDFLGKFWKIVSQQHVGRQFYMFHHTQRRSSSCFRHHDDVLVSLNRPAHFHLTEFALRHSGSQKPHGWMVISWRISIVRYPSVSSKVAGWKIPDLNGTL